MNEFILIVFFMGSAPNATGATSVEFASEVACNKAAAAIETKFTTFARSVFAICVSKR